MHYPLHKYSHTFTDRLTIYGDRMLTGTSPYLKSFIVTKRQYLAEATINEIRSKS